MSSLEKKWVSEMIYDIIWSRSAEKQLKKLDRSVAKRIYKTVGQLREDPYRSVRKIVNSPWYRIRVGDYRVIIDIQQNKLRVLVLEVGPRKTIYR